MYLTEFWLTNRFEKVKLYIICIKELLLNKNP